MGHDPALVQSSVLVVEDEFLIAMELCELLEDAGYRVIGPVATVAEALKMLGKGWPHVCLLDVNLRGEISAPVAHALREHKVPFLLSSAYEQETLDRHPAFVGAVNIGKPAPPATLLSMLQGLLKPAR